MHPKLGLFPSQRACILRGVPQNFLSSLKQHSLGGGPGRAPPPQDRRGPRRAQHPLFWGDPPTSRPATWGPPPKSYLPVPVTPPPSSVPSPPEPPLGRRRAPLWAPRWGQRPPSSPVRICWVLTRAPPPGRHAALSGLQVSFWGRRPGRPPPGWALQVGLFPFCLHHILVPSKRYGA